MKKKTPYQQDYVDFALDHLSKRDIAFIQKTPDLYLNKDMDMEMLGEKSAELNVLPQS